MGAKFSSNLWLPTSGSTVQLEPLGYAGGSGPQDIAVRSMGLGANSTGTIGSIVGPTSAATTITAGASATGQALTMTAGAGTAGAGGLSSLVGGAGVGADKNAGGVTISTGNSTGAGTSAITFKTAPTAGSSSSANTAVTVLTIDNAGAMVGTSTADSAYTFTTTNTAAGGRVAFFQSSTDIVGIPGMKAQINVMDLTGYPSTLTAAVGGGLGLYGFVSTGSGGIIAPLVSIYSKKVNATDNDRNAWCVISCNNHTGTNVNNGVATYAVKDLLAQYNSGVAVGWTASATDPTAAADVTVSRQGIGILQVGTTTNNDSGALRVASITRVAAATGTTISLTGGAATAGVGGLVTVAGGAGVGTDKAAGGATVSTGNSSGTGLAEIDFNAPPTSATGATTNTAVTVAKFVKTAGGVSATTGIYNFVQNATGGALATNAIDGFLHVGNCAGVPTGTPTAFTGASPVVVDTTNNNFYVYSGAAWRNVSAGSTPTLGTVVNAGSVVNSVAASGRFTWTTGGTYAAGSTSQIYGPTDTGLFISSGTAGGAGSFGQNITITAADGGSSPATGAGSISITGGTCNAGAGAATGNVSMTGGSSGAGAGACGTATVTGGASGGSGLGGAASIIGGAGNASAGGLATAKGGAGVGTDKNSGGLTLGTGLSTGTGFSHTKVQTSFTLATGSTTQTLGDRFFVCGKVLALSTTTATTTTFASLSIPTQNMLGGTCFYTVEVDDPNSPNFSTSTASGSFVFSAVTDGTTAVAGNIVTTTESVASSTSGATLTTTGVPSIVASGASTLLLKVTPVFVGTPINARLSWTIITHGLTTVTPS